MEIEPESSKEGVRPRHSGPVTAGAAAGLTDRGAGRIPKWWMRISLTAKFMIVSALGVTAVAISAVLIVSWFQTHQIEERLQSFSVNELYSLRALVISAMNRRVGDSQNVAIGVFNDWFQSRNTDYPGRLWSVWGSKVAAFEEKQNPAQPSKKPRDAIDEEVLRTGQPVGRFVDGAYRYSLPIVFGVTPGADGQNCKNCHGALMGLKKGEVIAVFSSMLSTSADFAALQRFLLLLTAGAALAAVAITAAIWGVFGHLVGRPFTVMTGAITALAQGEESAAMPRHVKRTDEVGRLATAVEFFKRAEDERRRLADAFKDAAIGLSILDAGTNVIVSANPAFVAMYGMSAEEINGKRIDDFAQPVDTKHAPSLEERLADAGSSSRVAYETLMRRKDGSTFKAMITIGQVSSPENSRSYRIASQIDVTESRDAEERIRHLEKMEAIGALTGGVAHDFNNLLGVIIGNLDILIDQVGQLPDAAELAGDALGAALRGSALTRRMLAFARPQPLQLRPTDINALVAETAKLLRRTLREDIEITTNFEPAVWLVTVDPVQLEAALTNLATNARDAMPAGGKLWFTTANVTRDADQAAGGPDAAPGDYVVIEASDNGTGMTPEVLRHIFEPFYTTKSTGHGTGLGLSMVFGFMKQSGGHIDVASEPGVGTTFRLFLPRCTETGIEMEDDAPPTELSGHGETVLVVEDNVPLRAVVVRQLRGLGYRVQEAENGPAALALLQDAPFDVLFTDIMMPGGMHGIELAEAAVRHRPTLRILLTSGVPEAMCEAAKSRSVSMGLLPKPYRQADLARVLRELLDS